MRFLFVDRILELSPGKTTRGIKQVSKEDYYLTQAADGRACFMPSLIGETLGQLAAWNAMEVLNYTRRPVAGIVTAASMRRPAFVGETLLLESHIDSIDEASVSYHSVAYVGQQEVFRIESALGPMLPMESFIEPSVVKQQFKEIYRPGDWVNPVVSGEGQLTTPELIPQDGQMKHLTYDRIQDFISGQSVTAVKYVSLAQPWFADHFPLKPVLPLTVLLECKLNLAKAFIKQSDFSSDIRQVEMRRIKMNAFVLPGDVVVSYLKVKNHSEDKLTLTLRSEVDGKRVCVVELVMYLREEYEQ